MKYCILTSDQPRHEAFITTLSQIQAPEYIVKEKKRAFHPEKLKKEKEFFSLPSSKSVKTFSVDSRQINSDYVESLLLDNPVDFCLVFGTSILKSNILKKVDTFINIHTGLTQYYRGVESCFWALHDKTPEKIGVTIHNINLGIDTGKIYAQSRIKIVPGDDLDALFFKTCKAGFDVLKKNLLSLKDFTGSGVKLKKGELGKLYNKRDINESFVKELNENYNSTILEYFQTMEVRNRSIKLIMEKD